MAFVKGNTCLDDVMIRIITEYDEENPDIRQIRLEISHENFEDTEIFIFPDGTQIKELDLDAKIQEYWENHWDGGASWQREFGG